mgnify:CR=1 FL=1
MEKLIGVTSIVIFHNGRSLRPMLEFLDMVYILVVNCGKCQKKHREVLTISPAQNFNLTLKKTR